MENNLKFKIKNKIFKFELKTKSLKLKADESGQVLLLSVLVLSGIIVSISFFIGYLTVQRLKQAVISVDSAQAFYLSDAGIEYELYRYKHKDLAKSCPPLLPNNASFQTSVQVIGDVSVDPVLGLDIKSIGYSSCDSSGNNCKVSRIQRDTSQNVAKGDCTDNPALCPAQTNPAVTYCK